jgi:hypothetical protein
MRVTAVPVILVRYPIAEKEVQSLGAGSFLPKMQTSLNRFSRAEAHSCF